MTHDGVKEGQKAQKRAQNDLVAKSTDGGAQGVRDELGRWKAGRSGNPRGANQYTSRRGLQARVANFMPGRTSERDHQLIWDALVEQAKEKDPWAQRLYWDLRYPPAQRNKEGLQAGEVSVRIVDYTGCSYLPPGAVLEDVSAQEVAVPANVPAIVEETEVQPSTPEPPAEPRTHPSEGGEVKTATIVPPEKPLPPLPPLLAIRPPDSARMSERWRDENERRPRWYEEEY